MLQRRISLLFQRVELQLLQKYIGDLLIDFNGLNVSHKMPSNNMNIVKRIRRLVLECRHMLRRSSKNKEALTTNQGLKLGSQEI